MFDCADVPCLSECAGVASWTMRLCTRNVIVTGCKYLCIFCTFDKYAQCLYLCMHPTRCRYHSRSRLTSALGCLIHLPLFRSAPANSLQYFMLVQSFFTSVRALCSDSVACICLIRDGSKKTYMLPHCHLSVLSSDLVLGNVIEVSFRQVS